MKFRKKPVVIEAWKLTQQWINQQHVVDPKAFDLIENEDGSIDLRFSYIYEVTDKIYFKVYKDKISVFIKTLEGDHEANIGDWIITGVKGEMYPCNPDIFEMIYERVEDERKKIKYWIQLVGLIGMDKIINISDQKEVGERKYEARCIASSYAMKIEEQVTSLELSKRLKELGFEQESIYYWIGDEDNHVNFNLGNFDASETMDCFSAYTVAELGKLLPDRLRPSKETGFGSYKYYYAHYFGAEDRFIVGYDNIDNEKFVEVTDKNEADARAQMLIYLKENNLI